MDASASVLRIELIHKKSNKELKKNKKIVQEHTLSAGDSAYVMLIDRHFLERVKKARDRGREGEGVRETETEGQTRTAGGVIDCRRQTGSHEEFKRGVGSDRARDKRDSTAIPNQRRDTAHF